MPTYLWKIYDRLSLEDEELLHPKQNAFDEKTDGFTDEHARIIEMSDTIMTFLNNRSYFE